MNKENILITGCDGMLGAYVDFGMRMNRDNFDVTNFSLVMNMCLEKKPSVILHLAAITDLSLCEKEPALAYLVNTVGAYHVALAARAVGAKFVFLSTSGVFDGTKQGSYEETDAPNPVNVYGHSKYLAELMTASMLEDYLIIRTSWLFGGAKLKDKKFVGKMISLRDVNEVHVVNDKYGSPTYAKDLVAEIIQLLKEDKRGIIHLGGEVATRYDVAREIFSILNSSVELIAISSTEDAGVYKSGKNESMSVSRPMRPWRKALRAYISEEWDGGDFQHKTAK